MLMLLVKIKETRKELNIGPAKGQTPQNGGTEFSICGFPFSLSGPSDFSNMNIPGLNLTQWNKGLIPKFTEKEESIIFNATKNRQNFAYQKNDIEQKGQKRNMHWLRSWAKDQTKSR